MDGDGNGRLFYSPALQNVRPPCSPLIYFANCPNRCQRSMFVARDEHDNASVIVCPLPDCDHAWCKHCQQSIDFNGPKHSCDGTLELDHLVKEQGWKYCPSESPPARFRLCSHLILSFPPPSLQHARRRSRKCQGAIT